MTDPNRLCPAPPAPDKHCRSLQLLLADMTNLTGLDNHHKFHGIPAYGEPGRNAISAEHSICKGAFLRCTACPLQRDRAVKC